MNHQPSLFRSIHVFHLATIVVLTGLLVPSTSRAADEKKLLTFESGSYRLRLTKDAAWTIWDLCFKNEVVGNNQGFWGAVMRPDKGNSYTGTGHHEGGKEEIQSVSLQVNGKTAEAGEGGVHQGQQILFRKVSRLHNLELTSMILLTPHGLKESYAVKAVADQHIEEMYLFMHPWITKTDQWLARQSGGKVLEGDFSQTHNLLGNLDWVALHATQPEVVIVSVYPEAVKAGSKGNFLWKREVYHKFYLDAFAPQDVTKGFEQSWTLLTACKESPGGDWKPIAEKLAGELPGLLADKDKP